MNPGRVDQPGRDTDRARVEGLLGVHHHRRQFRLVRGTVVGAEDGGADLVVTREEGCVGA